MGDVTLRGNNKSWRYEFTNAKHLPRDLTLMNQ